MVKIICTTEGCANENVEYNFLGNPPFVECGGCKEHLIGTDYCEDPEVPPMIMGDFNGS
jgi:hypothetical protein